jgi:membrane protein implicated in regulation of membrane protease activity
MDRGATHVKSSPWLWVWAWLGALLLVVEVLTLGLFMLPFGIGAAAAALGAWLGLSGPWQVAIFSVVSGVCFVLLQWYAKRHRAGPSAAVAGDRLVGKTGVVIEGIDRASGSGRARVNFEEWRADSWDNLDIPVGARVIVHRVEGAHLVVCAEDED